VSRKILAVFVWLLYAAWTRSWRLRINTGPRAGEILASGEPLIFAHWHGDELAIVHLVTRYRIATMTSTSKDGELIDFVIRHLGGATSRGSSTRGGSSALRGLVRLCRQGWRASVAVDGPKGPIYVIKPGVFELARLANAKILPVGVAAPSALHFPRSWNKTFMPWPFSRVQVFFADPLDGDFETVDPRDPDLAKRLSDRLSDARQQAAKLIAL
jgi:hypothetical protein